jgi:alkylation response protein AidB-like acyl-CoA dehydrogenase
MVATGRYALAIELSAIADRVVANAVGYTKERHQYGRPIGSFQALQHRLAAAHASVVGAGNVAREAARSGDGWTAMVAKYLAGRAAEGACTQAQQSYGAIGFTWEHDFHRSLRRVYLLDRLFGGWRELEVEIGETLHRTGNVPKIGHL